MSLTEYRRKRNFRVTSEPRARRGSSHTRLSFVVQKHAASHLHYDFRLELAGVLKSWAVPKGPSLDPRVKRLAMQVEDHPLDYGKFEGIIPAGQYGGGTVMLWDQGTWEPLEDAAAGLRAGHLKFTLHGEKLRGRWMLVRRGGKKASTDEHHWFLFKERDEFASDKVDVTEKFPLSVSTERSLDDIALAGAKQTAHAAKAKPRKTTRVEKKSRLSNSATVARRKLLSRKEVKRAALPRSVKPELATLVKQAPDGEEWLHEIKFDGYRMLCRIVDGKARFFSRNNQDWTDRFGVLAEAAANLPVKAALLDGEVVALDPDGKSSFQRLQNIFRAGSTSELLYYAFDILHLDGRDVTALPLVARKDLLSTVIPVKSQGVIRHSTHIVGDGPAFFEQASAAHLEGIISKRRDEPYRGGRGLDWLKIKAASREEFVIGGFTPPAGARAHLGALLLGYYNPEHKLVYAGRVGTGFDDRTLADLHKRLRPLVVDESPFVNLQGTTGAARGVKWVQPKLVAQVEFSNWTSDLRLRHPSFQGLREDKPAAQVVRDEAISPAMKKQASEPGTVAKKCSSSRQTEAADVAGVRLSHSDKMLYAEAGITKFDLARYYEQIADWILPHVVNRPLALVRCPAGFGGKCFFQKHPGEGATDALRRVKVKEKGGTEDYLVVDDLAGLVSLVQMGVLEIHTWGSQADRLERPDRLTFDLDPDPQVPWAQVVAAAREVRQFLDELGLRSFVKTTGGKGLHIVVPIERRASWPQAKSFCRAVAQSIVTAAPERYIATMSKAQRHGKIFIDYLRNDRGATAIAAYSTRARAGATVSMPLDWSELGARMHSDHFTVANAVTRLAKLKHDPWQELSTTRQSITAVMLRQLEA